MAKIILKGEIDPELIGLGIKSGDTIIAQPDLVSKVGAMQFTTYYNTFEMHCVVWPVNYDILEA